MSNNLNIPPLTQPPPTTSSDHQIVRPSTSTSSSSIYKFQGHTPLFIHTRSSNSGGPQKLSPIDDIDCKRLRKSGLRKTVDPSSSYINMIKARVWQRDYRDRPFLQPDVLYTPKLLPPECYIDNHSTSVATNFVKSVTNKIRCPIFCLAWTPEGRRLLTGSFSGEFTLWNGLTFNFETILQAHDSPVRAMVWSHNSNWMVTGDNSGFVKYWQSNMNNVNMFQAHVEPIRGVSFSRTDEKFATCSDDATLRVWDFFTNKEEKVLRGHGADVKCVDWHPHKGLLISGSKDNQHPIKLWDPKSGESLITIRGHKKTVTSVKWNNNGNWVATASRDHLIKIFDIRNLTHEMETFRGHLKEVSSIAWHPIHESLLCSGGADGTILYWNVNVDKEIGSIVNAHDSTIWSLAWHPLGEVLCSGSNDYSSKFWTRNRPGDSMTGKYYVSSSNMFRLNKEKITTDTESTIIPGMGLEGISEQNLDKLSIAGDTVIPLLNDNPSEYKFKSVRKYTFSKSINKKFKKHWYVTKIKDDVENKNDSENDYINSVLESVLDLIPGSKLANELKPESLLVCGQMIKVDRYSKLENAIKGGRETLLDFLNSGEVPEVRQHIQFNNNNDPIYKYGDHHLRNDQNVSINPFNEIVDMPMDQDVDYTINTNYNQSGGYSDHFRTASRQFFIPHTITSRHSQSPNQHYGNLHNIPLFQQFGHHQHDMQDGPMTDFHFPMSYHPQGSFQNYNNM